MKKPSILRFRIHKDNKFFKQHQLYVGVDYFTKAETAAILGL